MAALQLRHAKEHGLAEIARKESVKSLCSYERRAWRSAGVRLPCWTALRSILAASDEMTSFESACGVFAAVVSTPGLRPPSEWIELIKGEHVFANVADAQRFASGVMALYNEVARSVTELDAHCCPPPEDHRAVQEFCEGYLRIAASEVAAIRSPDA